MQVKIRYTDVLVFIRDIYLPKLTFGETLISERFWYMALKKKNTHCHK